MPNNEFSMSDEDYTKACFAYNKERAHNVKVRQFSFMTGYAAAIKDLNTRKSDFIDKLNETRKKYEQASHKVPTNVLVAAWRDRAKNLSQYPDNSGACAIYRVCARELETALAAPLVEQQATLGVGDLFFAYAAPNGQPSHYGTIAERAQEGPDWGRLSQPIQPAPQAGATEVGQQRCQHCIDRRDGFYGSYAPPCPTHDDDGKLRATPHPTEQPSQDAEVLAKIRTAITDYHLALDHREHDGVAAGHVIHIIQCAVGMPWVQGAAAQAQHKSEHDQQGWKPK